MPQASAENADTWNVFIIEDDDTVRRQVKESLENEVFASRKLKITEFRELPEALNLIKDRKADLVILDVYRGRAVQGGEQTGVKILDSIKRSGFVPVVLYTALPEGLDGYSGKFVRLVGKESGGLTKLREEIENLFQMRIPQLNRAIIDHLDQALCHYMWDFVQKHWEEFGPIIEQPEFLRLVVQRLAMTFARQGIEEMTAQLYGTPVPGPAGEHQNAHPAEFYIKPPIGTDPKLGDIRVRHEGGRIIYLIVLWPSCDMVSTGGRSPKTDLVLCAKACPAGEMPEVVGWLEDSSGGKKKKVERLLKNDRENSPDRYHFLPGAWDIPDLVVDFQALEHDGLAAICALDCLATLASPFAEALSARFQRYIGRVGTPDLDVDLVVTRMRPPN